MNQNDNKKPENPNYPGFAESMRELTAIRTNNPVISTISDPKVDSKGKRVMREFSDGKRTFSEMDQTKKGETIQEMKPTKK